MPKLMALATLIGYEIKSRFASDFFQDSS